MSLKKQASRRSDVNYIDPRILSVEPGYNLRVIDPTTEQNQSLKQSIIANGVLKPITVETAKVDGHERFYIRDGERRWRMAMEAISEGVEIKAVPAISVKLSQEEKVLHIFVSNDGQRLTQLEQGEGFKRLVGYGWTEKQIGEKTGLSSQHVRNCIELFSLPPDLKRLVFEGKISSTLLLQLSRELDGNEDLIREAIENGICEATVDGKEKVTKKHLDPKPKKIKQKIEITEEESATFEEFIDCFDRKQIKDYLQKFIEKNFEVR